MNPFFYIRKQVFKAKQAEFAVLANSSQASVSRWENDQTCPTLNEMRAIRGAAISRGIEWNDDWFYSVPSEATQEGTAPAVA